MAGVRTRYSFNLFFRGSIFCSFRSTRKNKQIIYQSIAHDCVNINKIEKLTKKKMTKGNIGKMTVNICYHNAISEIKKAPRPVNEYWRNERVFSITIMKVGKKMLGSRILTPFCRLMVRVRTVYR